MSVKHQGVKFHPLKINLKASSKINKKNKRNVGCGGKMSRMEKHNFYALNSRLNLQTL
jgi:hypothetical protein